MIAPTWRNPENCIGELPVGVRIVSIVSISSSSLNGVQSNAGFMGHSGQSPSQTR